MRDRAPIKVAMLLAGMLLTITTLSCGESGFDSDQSAGISTVDVVEEQRTFVDSTRTTRANGTAPALPYRELITRIWYPPTALGTPACRGDRCALVLLAHGFGGNTSRFDAIARLLASAGYVVAAPAFPLTNDQTPGGHFNGLSDAENQPADLSFVIDSMLAADADPGDVLYRRIDGDHIGALGHSLGGTTVIGATRTTCCTDARIQATVYVAPAAELTNAYFGQAPSADGPPTLVINGADDPLVDPASAFEFALGLNPPWYFFLIPDVGHVFLIENIGTPQPPLFRTAAASQGFFDEYLGGVDGATTEGIGSDADSTSQE